jgi:hypothetical protein
LDLFYEEKGISGKQNFYLAEVGAVKWHQSLSNLYSGRLPEHIERASQGRGLIAFVYVTVAKLIPLCGREE